MMVARLFCNVLLTEAAAGRPKATSVIETMLRLATSPYLFGSGKKTVKMFENQESGTGWSFFNWLICEMVR